MRLLNALSRSFSCGVSESMPPALMRSSSTSSSACSRGVGPPVLVAHPERRLRLTVGLRRIQGRWQVTHEHHSFADETSSPV